MANSNNNWSHISLILFRIETDTTDFEQKLCSITNDIQIFNNINECKQYIGEQNCRIIFVIHNQWEQDILPHIHDFEQIWSIYIFGVNPEQLQSTLTSNKVRGRVENFEDLVDYIKVISKRQQKMQEPLPMKVGDIDRSSTRIDGNFLFLHILIDFLIQMNSTRMSEDDKKNELIDSCRKVSDTNQDNIFDEFKHDYTSEQALIWYTRETFIYRMVNKALRIQNIDLIIAFRHILHDIDKQLLALQSQQEQLSAFQTYRSQLISHKELKVLLQSNGELVSINSFFSTSLDERHVRFLLESGKDTADTKRVLFTIDVEQYDVFNTEITRHFADISSYSQFENEKEVLFMPGCIFQVLSVKRESKHGIYIIRLTLYNDDKHKLKELYEHEKINASNSNFYTLGVFLYKSGKLNAAEQCFHRYIKAEEPFYLASLDYNVSYSWDMLSKILMDRRQQQNYDIKQTFENPLGENDDTVSFPGSDVAFAVYATGLHQYQNGYFEDALDSCENVFKMFCEAFGEQHMNVTKCLNNLAIVYRSNKNYNQALVYYQQTFNILSNNLPNNHPRLAQCYMNIGEMYHTLDEHDLALQYYNNALQIQQNSLPAEHISIAKTYKSIGYVYMSMNEYRKTIKIFSKAWTIFQKNLPQALQHMQQLKNDVEQVKHLL